MQFTNALKVSILVLCGIGFVGYMTINWNIAQSSSFKEQLLLIARKHLEDSIREAWKGSADLIKQRLIGNASSKASEVETVEAPKVRPTIPTGPVDIDKLNVSVLDVYKLHKDVRPGGIWYPKDRKGAHSVAIIVPYRERRFQLYIFLNHMHTFLSAQNLDYRIYIVEQLFPTDTFNRATSMNVGFAEARKDRKWDCYFFHDVDLLPQNQNNIYRCRDYPTHYTLYLDKWKYIAGFVDLFGGIVSLTEQQMRRTNGFSNSFWGWGGEDDDMRNRLKIYDFKKIFRQNPAVGRISTIKHKAISTHNKVNPDRWNLIKIHSMSWYKSDGLNTLLYDLHRRENEPLYTWLLVSYKKEEMEKARDKSIVDLESKDPKLKEIAVTHKVINELLTLKTQ